MARDRDMRRFGVLPTNAEPPEGTAYSFVCGRSDQPGPCQEESIYPALEMEEVRDVSWAFLATLFVAAAVIVMAAFVVVGLWR